MADTNRSGTFWTRGERCGGAELVDGGRAAMDEDGGARSPRSCASTDTETMLAMVAAAEESAAEESRDMLAMVAAAHGSSPADEP